MKFIGIDNQSIEIKITNYLFPETSDRDWDGNWLNIYLKVTSKAGHWQTTDTALTTWEVQEIVDWLANLSDNLEPEWKELRFTEPHLVDSCHVDPGFLHVDPPPVLAIRVRA